MDSGDSIKNHYSGSETALPTFRQRPWSTEEDQARSVGEDLDRYRRDCRDKILQPTVAFGIDTYVPRYEYSSVPGLTLQRYMINVHTEYVPSEADDLKAEVAKTGIDASQLRYQHLVVNAIRTRLRNRLFAQPLMRAAALLALLATFISL